jgi:hypothetical protein
MDEKRGVIQEREEFFDTFSAETHGFGSRHDAANCTDKSCAHPDHGNSTAGPNFEDNRRAGDVRPDEGRPPLENADRRRNNLKIAAGNAVEIIEGIDEESHANCDEPGCPKCNQVTESTLQREVRTTSGGGSGSSGRKRGDVLKAPVCTECHLEYCRCGGVPRRGRRRRVEIDGIPGRSEPITFKVSAEAKVAMRENGVDGALIELVGRAVIAGVSVDEMAKMLDEKAGSRHAA